MSLFLIPKRENAGPLSAFLDQHTPSNIILAGDLNIVLKAKEKRGGSINRDSMLAFVEELAQQLDLSDFKPIRGLYTWSNNRFGPEHISARLDRFLVQGSLIMDKKIIKSKILPKLASDHKPIQWLIEDEEDLGPLPFRFSAFWIERDGFYETVEEAWAKSFSGSPSYVWEQKIKSTKQALKEWIRKPTPTPTSIRKEAVSILETLQTELESKEITTEQLEQEVKAQAATYRSFIKEEEYW